MDIRAVLTWNAGSGGNYEITFKDDPFLSSEWEPIPYDALCEQKAVVLHLPEGWGVLEIEGFAGRFALVAPNGAEGLKGKMIESDCELRDGWIKANYTDKDGKAAWEKIPFSD